MKISTERSEAMRARFERREMELEAIERVGFRGFPMMFHPHVEILCVLEGEIKMNVDGVERILHSGEICAVFPYVLHSYEDAPSAHFRLFMFAPRYMQSFESELFSLRPQSPFMKMSELCRSLTEKAMAAARTDHAFGKKALAGYLSAIITEILTENVLLESKNMQGTTMQTLLMYCNEHFDKDISVSSAAKACFVSESFVSKTFAQKIGCSFRTYVNMLRISEAKRLLGKSDMKITDVMYACGFKNQSSFNRVFFKECKTTPREYRSKRSKS